MSEFEDLLAKNPGQFHFARTARCLQHQWQSLKQYSLLADQSVQPLLRDNPILNFLDAESSINDAELFDSNDLVMDAELASGDRRYACLSAIFCEPLCQQSHVKIAMRCSGFFSVHCRAIKEIRHLEADIQKWQVLVDKVRKFSYSV